MDEWGCGDVSVMLCWCWILSVWWNVKDDLCLLVCWMLCLFRGGNSVVLLVVWWYRMMLIGVIDENGGVREEWFGIGSHWDRDATWVISNAKCRVFRAIWRETITTSSFHDSNWISIISDTDRQVIATVAPSQMTLKSPDVYSWERDEMSTSDDCDELYMLECFLCEIHIG